MGPFKVLEVIGDGKLAYKLELPAPMRVHPVFHVSLLEPYREDVLPGKVQGPPLPFTRGLYSCKELITWHLILHPSYRVSA